MNTKQTISELLEMLKEDLRIRSLCNCHDEFICKRHTLITKVEKELLI